MSSLEVITVSCYCETCKTDVEIIDVKYLGMEEIKLPVESPEGIKKLLRSRYHHKVEYILDCGHPGIIQSFCSKDSEFNKSTVMNFLRTDPNDMLLTQRLGGIRILNCRLNLPDFHRLQEKK